MVASGGSKIRLGLICFCWASGWYDWYAMFLCWTVKKESWKKKTKKTSEVYDNPSIVICGSTVLQIEQYLIVAIWILNMLQYLPIHDSKNPYPYMFVCIHSVLRLLSTCSQHSSSGLDGASANVGFTLLQGMLQEENLPCSCTYCVCYSASPNSQIHSMQMLHFKKSWEKYPSSEKRYS